MQIQQFYQKYYRPGIITTDSRKIHPGDIFIALKGENFNGNRFAAQALTQGASVVVVDEDPAEAHPDIIQVSNCLTFLQDLAREHVKQSSFLVIGLTGSNGKTTTKELLHAVMQEKFRTYATKGNLNNHIGVPLTLLSVDPNAEYAIVEMGANHQGEIADLCSIAQPRIGLITNIGRAHLEGFGGIEGVKKAKGELYDYLKEHHGKIFFNANDPILCNLIGKYPNTLAYNNTQFKGSLLASSPLLSVRIEWINGNSILVNSNLYGEYNLINILAAASIGFDLGVEPNQIKAGIEKYVPENFRSQMVRLGSTTLILDCYNANPSSMKLALDEFGKHPSGKKIGILGGMKELGEFSQEEHQNINNQVRQLGFDLVLFYGDEFLDISNPSGKVCQSHNEIISILESTNLNNTTLLIKGSRSNKLEAIGNYLQTKLDKNA